MKEYYFVEKEGWVFTVERNDKISIPSSRKEVKFPFEIKSKIVSCPEYTVYYCTTKTERLDSNWIFKDDICVMDNVDKILRKATNMTYVRPSVLAIIEKNNKILMVKSTRGVSKGFWNLPGGFIDYMEKPEDGLKREVKEETNLDVKKMKLFGVYNHKFENPNVNHQYYMYGFVYLCEVENEPRVVDDEIEEIKYFSVEDAIKNTKNEFVKMALQDLKKQNKRIKAVVFDLDNTLIDFMKMKTLASESAISAMKDAGLEIDYQKGLRILKELFKEYGIENQRIFNIFLEKVLGKVDYKILSAGIVSYRKVKESFIEPYPNVIPTLIELIKRGYILGIVSDASRIQAWTRLCGMKLQHFFDFVITLDDTGVMKPDKRVFDTVKRKLNLRGDEIVFVGDDLVKDINGGNKAGFKTVFAKYGHVKTKIGIKHPNKKIKPDYTIKDIKDILDIL